MMEVDKSAVCNEINLNQTVIGFASYNASFAVGFTRFQLRVFGDKRKTFVCKRKKK
jgi:hypothetical protein